MPSKAPTSRVTQCRATQRKSRVVTCSAQPLQAIDRYEKRRGEFIQEGTYPKVWRLLGDLDLGGPNTFSGGERGEFNPAKNSSFGWDDVFYPLD